MLTRILSSFSGSRRLAHCEENRLRKTLRNDGASLSPYSVFVPSEYDGTKEYPIILFLYATGDSGGGRKLPPASASGLILRQTRRRSHSSSSLNWTDQRSHVPGQLMASVLLNVGQDLRTADRPATR